MSDSDDHDVWDGIVRWRWDPTGERLTIREDTRFSERMHTQLWKFAHRRGVTVSHVIRNSVLEYLAVHDYPDEQGCP